jgi:enolase
MDTRIANITGLEILDSRGDPTVRVIVGLECGIRGAARVPSGASTGENEALEHRDGDPNRFGGKGVLGVIRLVETEIAQAVVGRDACSQHEIDNVLIDLDGTPNKARLGANAILGVSIAVLRAAAVVAGMPLHTCLANDRTVRLPMPMMNVLNGGRHADSNLDFQEFMIMPLGAPSFREAVRYCAETYHALRDLLAHSGHTIAVGDEGGFAPRLASNEAGCELIVKAIERAGYRPGEDISLALDVAASSFHSGSYSLKRSGKAQMSTEEMIELYENWVQKYPIASIEDGLAERDWAGFRKMTAALGDRIQIVGDDLYVTNTTFIRRGIVEKCSNAVLIKPNQIGTVSETLEAVELCRDAGWQYVVSHRSGETDDTFIADFAAAMGGGQIKAGAPCRGERVAKYNRLLEIEHQAGTRALFSNPFKQSSTLARVDTVSNRSQRDTHLARSESA